jgi:N-acetylglucosamine-6-phosphate deacetylase
MLKEYWCDRDILKDTSEFDHEDEVYFLVPAMFDIQVNGYNQISLDDEVSVEALEKMAVDMYNDGVSQFVPTLISSDFNKILLALTNTREFIKKHPYIIPGLHLEGPFISLEKSGIHPKECIANIDPATLDMIIANRDVVAYMTVDPLALTDEQLYKLQQASIKLSLGHTNCNYKQAKQFFNKGCNMATHLYNAMSKSFNGRNPMAVEAILEHEQIYTGVICDGVHVDFTMVNLAKKLLGDYFILTTDAIAAAGVKDPADFPKFVFANKLITNDPQFGCVDDNGVLAGSCLTMKQGIINLVQKCGLTLHEAIYAASVAPRRALGVKHNNVYMVLDMNLNIKKIFKSE